MPTYAALLYTIDADWTAPEHAEEMKEYDAFGAAAGETIEGGAALFPTATATTVRVTGGKGGEVVTSDGPFAEAKEVLAGLYLLDAPDLDAAVRLAAQIPAAWNGAVELRPVIPDGRVTDASERLADLVRDEGRRVLATLVRTVGDLTVAEDAVSDAALAALRRWPVDGVPDNPRAWLTTVARNAALETLRREARRRDKEVAAVHLAALNGSDPDESPTDLLRLVFTCCHPALSQPAQVALALRTLCGLRTADVARLLLLPEATAAKRLTRARQKIAAAHIPYRVPDAEELPARLDAVATTVHLLFTAGHAGGTALVRPQLCDEAIRLARQLVALMPDESTLQGLLALMLLTDARRATRTDENGRLLRLAEQDRSRWDRDAIAEGLALVEGALTRSRLRAGRFELQAAIAACHAGAPSFADTDWDDVVALYDALLQVEDTPVVRLNRAVAVGERDGPARGLAELDAVPGLERLHLWHACRGALLDRLDRRDEAADAYRAALACEPSPEESAFLRERLATGR